MKVFENHGDDVDDDFTDILDARLRQRESDVERCSDEHVRCCHQDVSNAHVSTLTTTSRCSLFWPFFLTLFSWCLLLLMMVMIALWMNKPSAKIPVRLGNDDLETDLIIVKL